MGLFCSRFIDIINTLSNCFNKFTSLLPLLCWYIAFERPHPRCLIARYTFFRHNA